MNGIETAKLRLFTAVKGLYTEFAGYSHHHAVDFCPHCVSKADIALLYARPLRELTAPDLEKYAFKAMTTWGDPDDFKHFLPRIFELLTLSSPKSLEIDPEIAIGKMNYARWKTWPENEQAAVVNFLKAWLHCRLISEFSYSSLHEVSSCLESIAIVEKNLTPYLATWRADFFAVTNARLNTAGFLDFSQDTLYKGKLAWAANPSQAAQIINWLLEPEVLPLMEKTALEFFETVTDPELTAILEGGVNALETLKMLFPGPLKPETQA
jgi:hypothetical protein